MQITWAFYQKDSSNVKMMHAFKYMTSEHTVNCRAGDVRVHFRVRQLKNRHVL